MLLSSTDNQLLLSSPLHNYHTSLLNHSLYPALPTARVNLNRFGFISFATAVLRFSMTSNASPLLHEIPYNQSQRDFHISPNTSCIGSHFDDTTPRTTKPKASITSASKDQLRFEMYIPVCFLWYSAHDFLHLWASEIGCVWNYLCLYARDQG